MIRSGSLEFPLEIRCGDKTNSKQVVSTFWENKTSTFPHMFLNNPAFNINSNLGEVRITIFDCIYLASVPFFFFF